MMDLLEILRNHRMEYKLNEVILNGRKHQEMKVKTDRFWSYLLQMNFTKAQYKLIDRYLEMQNFFSAEYGEKAYELGLKDGFRLAREIRKIESERKGDGNRGRC